MPVNKISSPARQCTCSCHYLKCRLFVAHIYVFTVIVTRVFTHTPYTHTHTYTRHSLLHHSQMPEFRFRRRKPQNRRHTLHDADESAAQITAAKKEIQSVGDGEGMKQEEGEGKRNSMVQEREKFFELLKHKCSDEATRIELDHVLTNGGEEEEEEEEEETLMVCHMMCHKHKHMQKCCAFSPSKSVNIVYNRDVSN